MLSMTRHTLRALAVLTIAGLSLEGLSWFLLEALEAWPTRSQIQSTLAQPGSVSMQELRIQDSDLPMLREFVIHPYLGFVRNYDRPIHTLNRDVVDLSVNQLGFFGDLPPKRGSNEQLIVGVTGGSVASELFLFSRDILREALQDQPQFANRDVQIHSFALAGMKQPQQLMALNWLLILGYHLDLVVNLDGFNEVALPFGDNKRLGVFPGYPRNWRGYAARTLDAETISYSGRLEANKRTTETWRKRFSNRTFRNSSAALLTWSRILAVLERERSSTEHALRQHLENPKSLDAQTRGPASYATTPRQVVAQSVQYWERASRQMAILSRANDIAYWQFLQPNLYFPDTKPLSEWETAEVETARSNSYRYGRAAELGYRALEAAGTDLITQGVAFIDLSHTFETITETMYRDSCCHYTVKGYNQIAIDIAAAIGKPPPRP